MNSSEAMFEPTHTPEGFLITQPAPVRRPLQGALFPIPIGRIKPPVYRVFYSVIDKYAGTPRFVAIPGVSGFIKMADAYDAMNDFQNETKTKALVRLCDQDGMNEFYEF